MPQDEIDQYLLSLVTVRSPQTVSWYRKRLQPLRSISENISSISLPDLQALYAQLATRQARWLNHPSGRASEPGGLSPATLRGYVRTTNQSRRRISFMAAGTPPNSTRYTIGIRGCEGSRNLKEIIMLIILVYYSIDFVRTMWYAIGKKADRNTEMNAKSSTLHPLYNNLFVGPSEAQMTKIEKNRKAQEEYMKALHSYRNETGKDMDEAQAVEVYKSILAKWN